MQTIHNASDAVLVSFTDALSRFFGFIPALIGAIVILIIGWIISGIVARLIERMMVATGFERAVERSGIGGFLARTGTAWTASRVLAELAKWFIRLIFLQAAAQVLGMPQVTAVINNIVLYLPNVFVAVLIVVVGAMLARVVAGLVRGSVSEMGVANPGLFAAIAQYAILGFAAIAALSQLQIASSIVNILFIGIVAALALALGLAFGLGGREVAADMTRSWYEGGKRTVTARSVRQGGQPAAGAEPGYSPVRPTTWRSNAS